MKADGMFRKKPVTVEAHRFGGSSTEVAAFRAWIAGRAFVRPALQTRDLRSWQIETLEGEFTVSPGGWVIRGVAGEFYPCKPHVFSAIYEEEEQ